MFGFGGMTDEMVQRMTERWAERDRRVKKLMDERAEMDSNVAYIHVTCEMEHEAWAAAEKIKLDDISKNGT